MAEEKFRYDPEADDENNARKYRLPFVVFARGDEVRISTEDEAFEYLDFENS